MENFSIEWAIRSADHKELLEKSLATLIPLIKNKTIKPGMANKIAKSGLQYNHLSRAYDHGGEQRLPGNPNSF